MADDNQRTRTPLLAEVLRTAIEQRLGIVYTTLPGKIEKYDPGTQKADVKPLLQDPLISEDGTDLGSEILPVIPNVPVRFFRADFKTNKFFHAAGIKKGDLVTLHATQRSIDQWKSKPAGEDVDPADTRKFNASDCFAVPGLYPFEEPLVDAPADNMVMGRDDGGMQQHFTPDDKVEFRIGDIADMAVAVAEPLKTYLDTDVKNWATTHTHGTGVGPSGPPIEAAMYPVYDDDITSDHVKLKGN
ncbi:MAG: hypothetical protein MJA83_05655 [Gammaproteobacteria bacterium]|nr:hypothetical protein [Gammaproteobacteria bacterium]